MGRIAGRCCEGGERGAIYGAPSLNRPSRGAQHRYGRRLSPSVPFSILRAQQRFANAESPAISFATPAPANAYLRFSGHESKVEASFNGGPYQTLAEIPNMQGIANNTEFGQFFAPIPAGTQTVTFKVKPGWSGDWILQGFAIWAAK